MRGLAGLDRLPESFLKWDREGLVKEGGVGEIIENGIAY